MSASWLCSVAFSFTLPHSSEAISRRIPRSHLEGPRKNMASQGVKMKAKIVPHSSEFAHYIPATVVKGDSRTEEDRAHARAAYDLWLRDLRNIRPSKPLLDSTYVAELSIADTSSQKIANRNKAPVDLTDLSDNDDDDDNNNCPPLFPSLPPPVIGQGVGSFH